MPADINPRIIESLYCEALVLSDEVRAAFATPELLNPGSRTDEARIALSCEALRTTTRMMHAVAWLLNYRAYFAGDLSEFQLRRYGKLADLGIGEPRHLDLMDQPTRALIDHTERFHARLKRIDQRWRNQAGDGAGTVRRLHERLGRQLAG